MGERDAAYYRALPYSRRAEPVTEDGETYWLASVVELPSIEIHGDTREEALDRLDEIFDDCIEVMVDAGEVIPEPDRWPAPYLESGPRSRRRSAKGRARLSRPATDVPRWPESGVSYPEEELSEVAPSPGLVTTVV